MQNSWLLILCGIMFSLKSLLASVEVTKLNYSLDENKLRNIEINYAGRVVTPPHYVVYENSVAIKWPNAKLLNAINLDSNNVSLKNESDSLFIIFHGTKALSQNELFKLSLQLANNNIKTSIPDEFYLKNKKENKIEKAKPQIKLEELKNDKVPTIEAKEIKAPEIVKAESKKKDFTTNNEDYLSYLLSSVEKENKQIEEKKNDTKIKAVDVTKNNTNENEFKHRQESNSKLTAGVANSKEKNTVAENMNFSNYIFKIVFVLGFIVVAILLLAKVSKKVIAGKNKLGFLNNSKVVEVLNTTYIGPKRQLLLVKVYDQIILLGNSEAGLSFLSEVKELSQVLKFAEKEVTGNNFDSDLLKTPENSNVVLKDEKKVFESTPVNLKQSKMGSVLKNKAKALKAWQA